MNVNVVDLVAVCVVIAGAVAFIASRFHSPKPPACHQTGAPLVEEAPQVILGASLAKGLQRARNKEKRVNA